MVAQRKPRQKAALRVTYQVATYAEIHQDPAFHALFTAHHAELFPPEMGRPLVLDHGRYSRLSAGGMLKCYALRVDGALVGYADYLVMPTLHHGPDWVVALNDVTFISEPYRRKVSAARFLRFAEGQLRSQGVSVIYHHDPHRKPVGRLFERLGYKAVQTTYEKVL